MKRVDIKTGFLCNNNCLFCVQADNKCNGNRTFEEIKNDLTENKQDCDGVVFTGGEVTIRKDIFDLVKLAKELGYKTIQIQSNGRMFSSMDFCKKIIEAGATEFSPAIHGYNANQHDYLTQSKGSFAQTIKGVQNLKKLNQTIIINSVITKANYTDLPKMAKLFAKLKVTQYQFAFMHALGNAKDNFDSLMPNMTLASEYIKKGLDIGMQNNIRCMVEAVPFCILKGYERFISENYIPDTKIRGREWQNTDNYKEQRLESSKLKSPNCKLCKYDKICEGPWKEYPQKKGFDEFNPVKNE